MTRFWKQASTEERLAQIAGAIELGMTGSQCAMNCGANVRTLHSFASRNNLHFPRDGQEAKRKQISGEVKLHALRKARAARNGVCLSDDDSALLFEKHHDFNLFEPHPNDEGAFA